MANPLVHSTVTRRRFERCLFTSDVHVPFHDAQLVDTVMDFAKWWKPDVWFHNGDIADFYEISKFVKDTTRKENFQDELDDTREQYLERAVKVAPTRRTTHYYIPGNHEDRSERYLHGNASALAPLRCLKLGALLELERLGITLAPRAGVLLRDDWLIYHGQKVAGETGATAKAEAYMAGMNGITGHVHRLGSYRHTSQTGTRVWYEQGCLCTTDPEFIIGRPNWAQGFIIGEFDTQTDMHNIQTIAAAGGRFAHDEKIWGE